MKYGLITSLVVLFLQSISHLRILQIKEYRYDRIVDFISSKAGKKYFINYRLFARLFFLFMTILTAKIGFLDLKYNIVNYNLDILTWFFVFLYFFSSVLFRYKKPKITLKILILFFISVFISLFFYIILPNNIYSGLLLSIMGLPIVMISWYLFMPIDFLIKRYIYVKAQKKVIQIRKLYPNIKIVAVSGAVGKSSFKSFLVQLLGNRAIYPSGHINSDVAISKWLINLEIDKDNPVIVMEYGAYKKGEVELLCKICPPDVAVMTEFTPQHINLYGSMENIIEGDTEIIKNINKNGIAIINRDIEGFEYIKQSTDKPIKTISKVDVNKLKIGLNGIKFEYKNLKWDLPNLLGKHFLTSLLLASNTANYLGMSWEMIAKKSIDITTVAETMELKKINKNLIIIDDSYNTSLASSLSAIEFLANIKNQENNDIILVQSTVLELGSMSKDIHYKIGFASGIAEIKVLFTGNEFKEDFIKGFQDAGGNDEDTLSINELNNNGMKGIYLLEGRDARKIYKILEK